MFIKRDDCSSVQDVVERNTGMTSNEFLHPDVSPHLHGLQECVKCLRMHFSEPITIVGDYDADGICASAIMYHGLLKAGKRARTRLPYRFSEGYGLSEKIIDEIDSGVVITVDNGIAAHKAIKKAKEKGLTVIVTDHHLAVRESGKPILPEADAILDPNADDVTTYKLYCGAGLALRFVQELTGIDDHPELEVLAAIATVADVMQLKGANWMLVKKGLNHINAHHCLPGLEMLLQEINLQEEITEEDFGFKLGPIFNASGRLYDDGAERVLEVLKADHENTSLPAAVHALIEANDERKRQVKEYLPIAEKLAGEKRPIVIYHPQFGEGIIGILAGNLCEKYHCPVIVFTKTSTGALKGSGRSVGGIHLKEVLDRISERMIGYGGHEGAAGLSIPAGTLEQFREAFNVACGILPEYHEDVLYDLSLSPKTLDEQLQMLEQFAPYGEGNPKPIFRIIFQATKSNYRRIGDGSHFMIKGSTISLMAFDLAKRYEEEGMPEFINCIGYPDMHVFNNKCYYRFIVKDYYTMNQAR